MSIIKLYSGANSEIIKKKIELLKIDEKYYIELEEFENSDCVAELCLSLALENQSLKELEEVLEEKLRCMQKEL